MIISIDTEKTSDKPISLNNKRPEEINNRQNIPQHNKTTYYKPIANRTLHGKKLRTRSLKLGTKVCRQTFLFELQAHNK